MRSMVMSDDPMKTVWLPATEVELALRKCGYGALADFVADVITNAQENLDP